MSFNVTIQCDTELQMSCHVILMKNATFFENLGPSQSQDQNWLWDTYVIEEIGHYGSILSLLSDCDKHARAEEGMVTKWKGDCLWQG